MIKTYTYKIKPNKATERKFEEQVGVCRYLYNIAREWQEGKVQFIAGFDNYKKVECLNFYHKIRKFLGLKYKIKDRNINCTIFKVTDGAVEYITNRDEN